MGLLHQQIVVLCFIHSKQVNVLHALLVGSVTKNSFYSEASAFICGVQLHHNGAVSSNINLIPGQICTKQLIKQERALADYGITDFQSSLSLCDTHVKIKTYLPLR